MKWVDKFPDPGAEPAPLEKEPSWYGTGLKSTEESEEHKAWRKARRDFNTWIIAKRKHDVAKALDSIDNKQLVEGQVTAFETIALNVGAAFLDGGGIPDTSIFSGYIHL